MAATVTVNKIYANPDYWGSGSITTYTFRGTGTGGTTMTWVGDLNPIAVATYAGPTSIMAEEYLRWFSTTEPYELRIGHGASGKIGLGNQSSYPFVIGSETDSSSTYMYFGYYASTLATVVTTNWNFHINVQIDNLAGTENRIVTADPDGNLDADRLTITDAAVYGGIGTFIDLGLTTAGYGFGNLFQDASGDGLNNIKRVWSNTAGLTTFDGYYRYGGTYDSAAAAPTDAIINTVSYNVGDDALGYAEGARFQVGVDGAVATDNFDTFMTWGIKDGAASMAVMLSLYPDLYTITPAVRLESLADSSAGGERIVTADADGDLQIITDLATVIGAGLEIGDLSNVDDTGITDGQVLAFVGSSGTYEPADPGSGGMVYPGAGVAVSTGSAWDTSITQSYLVLNNQANTYTAGSKQSFQANATTAGLRLVGYAGNPSTLTTGDIWYNSSTNRVMYRGSTTTRELVARTLTQTLTNKTIAFGDNTVSGTMAQFDSAVTDGNPVFDSDFSANGILRRTAAGSYSSLTGSASVDTVEDTLTEDSTHIPTSNAVYDAIAAIPAGQWDSDSDGSVVLATPGNDVRLNTTERLMFNHQTTYISGPDGGTGALHFIANSATSLVIQSSQISIYQNLVAQNNQNLGGTGSAQWFTNVYAGQYNFAATGYYIDTSGTDMRFTDGSNTDVTLSSLVGGSSYWDRTGTVLEPATSGDHMRVDRWYTESTVSYITENGQAIDIYNNSQRTASYQETWVYFLVPVLPYSSKGVNLGSSTSWWDNCYVDRLYVDNTSVYIDVSGTEGRLTDSTGTYAFSDISGGGISWSGSTANGIGTYGSSSSIVAESNFTFDGTNAYIAGAGQMRFRATTCYINSSGTNEIAIYPGSYAAIFGEYSIDSFKDIIPYTGYLIDLGSSSIPWDNLYANSAPFVQTALIESISTNAEYHIVATVASKGMAKITFYGNDSGDHAVAQFMVSYSYGQGMITQLIGEAYSSGTPEFTECALYYTTADRVYGGGRFCCYLEPGATVRVTVENYIIGGTHNQWTIVDDSSSGEDLTDLSSFTQFQQLTYIHSTGLQSAGSATVRGYVNLNSYSATGDTRVYHQQAGTTRFLTGYDDTYDGYQIVRGSAFSSTPNISVRQYTVAINSTTNNSSYPFYVSGAIYATGNIYGYSDVRGKNVGEYLDPLWVLEGYKHINAFLYEYKENPEWGLQYGTAAQDWLEVFPHAVDYDEDEDKYGLKTLPLISLNTAAIKGVDSKTDELEKRVRELERIVEQLIH